MRAAWTWLIISISNLRLPPNIMPKLSRFFDPNSLHKIFSISFMDTSLKSVSDDARQCKISAALMNASVATKEEISGKY